MSRETARQLRPVRRWEVVARGARRYMELVLVKNAGARGADIAFNTEYLSHVQDEAGVTSTLRDRLTGIEYPVRSRYLVGADGARSRIVEELDLPIEGAMGRAGTIYTLFKVISTKHVPHRPSILHWIMTPVRTTARSAWAPSAPSAPGPNGSPDGGYDITGPEPYLRPELSCPASGK